MIPELTISLYMQQCRKTLVSKYGLVTYTNEVRLPPKGMMVNPLKLFEKKNLNKGEKNIGKRGRRSDSL